MGIGGALEAMQPYYSNKAEEDREALAQLASLLRVLPTPPRCTGHIVGTAHTGTCKCLYSTTPQEARRMGAHLLI